MNEIDKAAWVAEQPNEEAPLDRGEATMKYGLFWFLGMPIPVLIVMYLIFH